MAPVGPGLIDRIKEKPKPTRKESHFSRRDLVMLAAFIRETLRNHLRLSETCSTGPGRLSSLFSWDREWRAGQPLQNNLLHNIHLVDP
jgi:hypothetical protein